MNVVCPGYIDTEMVAAVPEKVLEGIIATIPVGRLGKAEEIAACVSFLAGPGRRVHHRSDADSQWRAVHHRLYGRARLRQRSKCNA